MTWILESFQLVMTYLCRRKPVYTVRDVFTILPKYGSRFIPTKAHVYDDDSSQLRSIAVNLDDPEAVISLGCTEEDDKLFGFLVTLSNEAGVNLNWFMGHPPEFQRDSLQLSVRRDLIQSEDDALALLNLGSDLQSILSPVYGYIVDYKEENANPVPFEYRRNSDVLPARIYWANFWGPEMVQRLGGLERVIAAPAHDFRQFADKGALLVATSTLLTYSEEQDVACRQAIWKWFALDRLHKEHSRIREQELLGRKKGR